VAQLKPGIERALTGEQVRQQEVSGFALDGGARYYYLVSYYPVRADRRTVRVSVWS